MLWFSKKQKRNVGFTPTPKLTQSNCEFCGDGDGQTLVNFLRTHMLGRGNSLKRKNWCRGFSPFEFMIAITIIIIIAAIFFVSFTAAQQRSRNSTRISQIKEYQKNFEAFRSDHGTYPLYPVDEEPQTYGSFVCLFDHLNDHCYRQNNEGGSVTEQQQFTNQLVPYYFKSLPPDPGTIFDGGSNQYSGAIYRYEDKGRSYRIQYFLEGVDRDCGLPETVGSSRGDLTSCVLVSS